MAPTSYEGQLVLSAQRVKKNHMEQGSDAPGILSDAFGTNQHPQEDEQMPAHGPLDIFYFNTSS